MTLDEFRQTLAAASAPPLPPLLRALWHDAKGDWDEAHRIAQDVSGADGAGRGPNDSASWARLAATAAKNASNSLETSFRRSPNP